MTTPDPRYVELLKRSVMDLVHHPNQRIEAGLDYERQKMGRSLTMIGRARLDNIEQCLATVIADGVPGDVMEAGVWRGGSCVFMKGWLDAAGETGRRVILADSFEGFPEPDPQYAADEGSWFHEPDIGHLNSRAEVEQSFRNFDLLDDRVVFLEGWFKDTLPGADVGALALLRLDADMYEATIQSLTYLYDRISPGGFLLIDDYPIIEPCVAAVTDFRRERGITIPIERVPNSLTGVFWRV